MSIQVRVQQKGADLLSVTAQQVLGSLLKLTIVCKVQRSLIYIVRTSNRRQTEREGILKLIEQSPFFFNPIKETIELEEHENLRLKWGNLGFWVVDQTRTFPHLALAKRWLGQQNKIKEIVQGTFWELKLKRRPTPGELQKMRKLFHNPLFQNIFVLQGGNHDI